MKLYVTSVEYWRFSFQQGTCNQKPRNLSPLIGIIGPASSSSSILVQNILKLFQIPQIGYSATTPELANTALYPYYLRVVPSDQFQNKLIIQLLKTFNWTYVSVVYTDGNYKWFNYIYKLSDT